MDRTFVPRVLTRAARRRRRTALGRVEAWRRHSALQRRQRLARALRRIFTR